ncbi:MAG: hypothetical protein EAZ21_01425 [Betaproteobacteria bacterium]|nr:MAG: hypothetical protein EAZ21_01425 [Betaproteobacteria bacterium]
MGSEAGFSRVAVCVRQHAEFLVLSGANKPGRAPVMMLTWIDLPLLGVHVLNERRLHNFVDTS